MKSKDLPMRFIAIDFLRVLAMLMVIVLHTIISFTMRPDFFGTKLWFVLEPIVAISKPAVLLFFMVSGYLVITKNRSIEENWEKTKKRIVIPLIFFSIMNLIYASTVFHFNGANTWDFWQKQLVRVTNFPSSPLWFLVVLLFFYLLNPVWQTLFSDEKNRNTARYIVVLSLAFSVFATIIKYPSLKNDFFYNNFTGWIGFVFFYLYGGLVRNKWINIGSKRRNGFLILVGVGLIMIGDFYTGYSHQHSVKFIWDGYSFDYLSIPIMLLAIGIFNVLVGADMKQIIKSNLGKVTLGSLLSLAPFSFGIYLIHFYIVSILTDKVGFTFDKLHINVYFYNLLNYSLVLTISLFITYIIKKLPFVRAIVGE